MSAGPHVQLRGIARRGGPVPLPTLQVGPYASPPQQATAAQLPPRPARPRGLPAPRARTPLKPPRRAGRSASTRVSCFPRATLWGWCGGGEEQAGQGGHAGLWAGPRGVEGLLWDLWAWLGSCGWSLGSVLSSR